MHTLTIAAAIAVVASSCALRNATLNGTLHDSDNEERISLGFAPEHDSHPLLRPNNDAILLRNDRIPLRPETSQWDEQILITPAE